MKKKCKYDFQANYPNASEWDKYIPDRYQKREEQNCFLGDQRMSEELRWSPDRPPKPQKTISCGNMMHLNAENLHMARTGVWLSSAMEAASGKLEAASLSRTGFMTLTTARKSLLETLPAACMGNVS